MAPCKVSIDGIHVSLTVFTPMVLMNIMVCKISLKAILDLVMALLSVSVIPTGKYSVD
jgi:hypothetical protein